MHPADYHAWYAHKCPGLTDSARYMLLPVDVLTDPRRSVMSFHSQSSLSDHRPPVKTGDSLDEGVVTDRSSIHQAEGTTEPVGVVRLPLNTLPELDSITFETVSRRAWTDIILQLLKVSLILISLENLNKRGNKPGSVCSSHRVHTYTGAKSYPSCPRWTGMSSTPTQP